MTSKANEQKACDAVQIMLELRFDHRRAEMWFPEADGRGPSVDLRGRLGRCEYALEHTRIEPFPGRIRTATRFSQFVRPIEQASSEGLYPELR